MAVRFAAGLLHDEEAAEDIVQEAARAILERDRSGALRLESADHARNYLFRVLRNMAVDARRGRAASGSSAQIESAVSSDPPPHEVLALREDRQRIDSVLEIVNSLRPRERSILRMRFGERRTFREISEETGISISTLHARMEAAIGKIRRKVGNRTAAT